MAAAVSDRTTDRKHPGYKAYPVFGNTRIFKGTLVAINPFGFAVPASNASALRVVGVAETGANNIGGLGGAIAVTVQEGVYRLAAASITQAMVGQMMYVVDDQTFSQALGLAGIKAGRLVEFIGATEGWLHVTAQSAGVVTASAGVAYTATEQALLNELRSVLNINVA